MEKYTIKITDQAKEHLSLIKDYIVFELKQPKLAKNILNLLKEGMLSLTSMPQRIKCIDENPWRDLGFRKIRVKNYYIYFWINDEKKEVQIIAVIYVKMNQPDQLSKIE